METEISDNELTSTQFLALFRQLKRLEEIADRLITTYEDIALHSACERAGSLRNLANAVVNKAMNMD